MKITRSSLQFLSRAAVAASLLIAGRALAQDPVEPFPAPEDGQTRHVIRLDPKDDENLFKVELIVGKTVMTDGANRHFFGGNVVPTNLDGWGYTYYVLPQLGPMAGTLMAPPPGAPEVETFVQVNHQLGLLRYNSRLPIVVYTPDDVEVRYRIWSAGEGTMDAASE